MKLADIADALNAHLQAMEAACPTLNFYHVQAVVQGRYVGVCYRSYWPYSFLSKVEAERYLAWLDSGNRGTHYTWSMQRQLSKEKA